LALNGWQRFVAWLEPIHLLLIFRLSVESKFDTVFLRDTVHSGAFRHSVSAMLVLSIERKSAATLEAVEPVRIIKREAPNASALSVMPFFVAFAHRLTLVTAYFHAS
jgi:hypothetical protein